MLKILLLIFEIQVAQTPTPGTPSDAIQSGSSTLPDSTLIGVFASVFAALLVYFARQWWEKRKLRKALLTEVSQMKGLKNCADRMAEISNDPSSRPLQPDDVPAPNSIPTVVYENNTGRIGLLGSFCGTSELTNAVEFYSKVIRYKSIISDIRNEEASNSDQEDLYDNISDLSEKRNNISETKSFGG